ncbi:hypothetical protein SEMRO_355_G124920.1 [Seminavis robusta]|uniref:Uncharacterized protein n=1 Tax=Seminavis robusta TaxID=568900 RepID=A0A9N8DXW1_9STRA|nr:hypothetical protein SEMRO_355_G124920.1 [Seminavis robusta]|eukprot:Sro355_g124920.1 n/a (186) ;mRNA; f:1408-1965
MALKPKEFANKEMMCTIFYDKDPFDDDEDNLKNGFDIMEGRIKPLSTDVQDLLEESVSTSIQSAKDCTLVVTIGGNRYWKPEEFKAWVNTFNRHGMVKRISTATNQCVVLLTKVDTAITILFFGNNKFDVVVTNERLDAAGRPPKPLHELPFHSLPQEALRCHRRYDPTSNHNNIIHKQSEAMMN